MRQNAHHKSTTPENFLSSFSDVLISLRLPSAIETSLIRHSYPRSPHLIGDQVSVSFPSALNHPDLQYHTLEENSTPPTPVLNHYPLRLDIQLTQHPTQDLR